MHQRTTAWYMLGFELQSFWSWALGIQPLHYPIVPASEQYHFFLFVVFWDGILLGSLGWPWTPWSFFPSLPSVHHHVLAVSQLSRGHIDPTRPQGWSHLSSEKPYGGKCLLLTAEKTDAWETGRDLSQVPQLQCGRCGWRKGVCFPLRYTATQLVTQAQHQRGIHRQHLCWIQKIFTKQLTSFQVGGSLFLWMNQLC